MVDNAASSVLSDAHSIVLARLSDGRQLLSEYRTVTELDSLIDHTVYASQQPENVAKNRYTNVLPYDYNVVAGNGSVGLDSYLNASIVQAEDRTSGMEFNYICSQVWYQVVMCVIHTSVGSQQADDGSYTHVDTQLQTRARF
jgi:protein tyrosine phosphatase